MPAPSWPQEERAACTCPHESTPGLEAGPNATTAGCVECEREEDMNAAELLQYYCSSRGTHDGEPSYRAVVGPDEGDEDQCPPLSLSATTSISDLAAPDQNGLVTHNHPEKDKLPVATVLVSDHILDLAPLENTRLTEQEQAAATLLEMNAKRVLPPLLSRWDTQSRLVAEKDGRGDTTTHEDNDAAACSVTRLEGEQQEKEPIAVVDTQGDKTPISTTSISCPSRAAVYFPAPSVLCNKHTKDIQPTAPSSDHNLRSTSCSWCHNQEGMDETKTRALQQTSGTASHADIEFNSEQTAFFAQFVDVEIVPRIVSLLAERLETFVDGSPGLESLLVHDPETFRHMWDTALMPTLSESLLHSLRSQFQIVQPMVPVDSMDDTLRRADDVSPECALGQQGVSQSENSDGDSEEEKNSYSGPDSDVETVYPGSPATTHFLSPPTATPNRKRGGSHGAEMDGAKKGVMDRYYSGDDSWSSEGKAAMRRRGRGLGRKFQQKKVGGARGRLTDVSAGSRKRTPHEPRKSLQGSGYGSDRSI